jgi:peptidoglycan/LPS O-acetylase OafA/YrhL
MRFYATDIVEKGASVHLRPNEHSRAYLHSLDGWRAIAVGAVMFDHAQPFGPRFVQHHLQNNGGEGVWLFFAISGLLICSRMMAEESTYGRVSLRNFYIRRAFRILPAALLYLLVIALLGSLAILPFDLPSWLGAVFFYRNYWHYFFGANTGSWFTGHFWSLSVEEHFYFLLPSVVVFFPRLRQQVLLLLTCVSFGWLALFLFIPAAKVLPPFWEQRTEFCISALLIPAVYALSLMSSTAREKAMRRLSPWVLCLIVAIIAFYDHQERAPRLFFLVLAKSIFNPLLLLSTILHPQSLITRFLETAPLRFIGRISYSLYLWQTLFLTRGSVFTGPIHALQQPAIGVACTFACAIASYYVVELPMIQFGRRFATARRQVGQNDPSCA